jgi:RND family efflux transporter MFP subunit
LLFAFCLSLFAFCLGCKSRNEATTEHEHESTAATLWTAKAELFMEYPALIVGQEAAFAVHLTDLKDFKPVTQGKLTCVFKSTAGDQLTVVSEAPSYPGIFRPVAKFSTAGVYDLELQLDGERVADIISEYLLAKAEYERAQRLFEKQAISQKRLDEAKLRFETKRSGFEVIARQVDFGAKNNGDAVLPHFHLTASIDGVIEEIHFHLGQTVQTGEKLFTMTNAQRVWLKANIPLALVARVQNASSASFKVEGFEQEFNVDQLHGKLISVGSMVEEKSRTVPVIFEVDNPNNKFKIGMFAEVAVQTGDAIEALAIPVSAIFDDNGTPVAYVHVEGEAFAKRGLQIGISDHGFTQILSGIAEGERIVTVGGYQVRLASLSTSVPTGHGHEH